MAIMGSFSMLATAEGGFGLNLDILETNVINLVIIIGVLIYFGRSFLGNTLSERRTNIEDAISDAEKQQKDAAAALADAQQKLAQAQAEAEQIRAKAEENANAARESILAASAKDVERMKASAVQDLNSERERAIAQLRQQVVALAMERVESQLKSQLDDSAQHTLVNRSIERVGAR